MVNSKAIALTAVISCIVIILLTVIIIAILKFWWNKRNNDIFLENDEEEENNIPNFLVDDSVMIAGEGLTLTQKEKDNIGYGNDKLNCIPDWDGRSYLYVRNKKGIVIKALVDTGASHSMFDNQFAIGGQNTGYKCNVRTAEGGFKADIVNMPKDTITLHDNAKNCYRLGKEFKIIKDDRGYTQNKDHCPILGMETLKGLSIECDHGNMYLTPSVCLGNRCVNVCHNNANTSINLVPDNDYASKHFNAEVIFKKEDGLSELRLPGLIDTGFTGDIALTQNIIDDNNLKIDIDKNGNKICRNLTIGDAYNNGKSVTFSNVHITVLNDVLEEKDSVLIGRHLMDRGKLKICGEHKHASLEFSPNDKLDMSKITSFNRINLKDIDPNLSR